MVKIIWTLIAINTLALFVFIAAYFVLNAGKHVDYQEKGWTMVLAGTGLLIILLAAIPIRFSKSTAALVFSFFFACLPLFIVLYVLLTNQLSAWKQQ